MKNGDYVLVIAPSDYPGVLYRGKYAYEHHIIYYKHTGIVISEGYNIHHKNGNKKDNRFENLELVKCSDHSSFHTLARGKTFVQFLCPVCSKKFIKEKRQSFLSKNKGEVSCCSKHCSGKWAYIKKTDKKLYEQGKKLNLVKIFKK